MTFKIVHPDAITRILGELSKIGCITGNPRDGFLRAGYSLEESSAIALFEQEATKLGLNVQYDLLGNFSAESISSDGRYIEFASHLDTVPFGGNYDGAAGVAAGLEAIRSVLQSGIPLRHGLRLRIWRLEEGSTYNSVCFGSKAAFGLVNPRDLENRFEGVVLRDAIRSIGFDPTLVESSTPTISQPELDSILAHVELHIEQANLLERRGLDIGIISSIRGPRRTKITVEGRFDHSGGTPMGKEFRSDANLAIAYMQVRLDQLFVSEHAESKGLVQTVGVVNSSKVVNDSDQRLYQNAAPKVSGFGYFIFESRGAVREIRDSYHETALRLISDTAKEFGVRVLISEMNASDGIPELNPSIQAALQKACDAHSFPSIVMPSGAMHDAAVLASRSQSNGKKVPVGMIFIPCRDGISHNPDEYTSPEAIAKGATVLAQMAYSYLV